jgi:uncharacterized protein
MSATVWLVPITALRRATGTQRHERRHGPLGELCVAETKVSATAEVDVDVVLSAIDGGIEVAGSVASDWEAECRRCLRPVGGRVEADVRELYRPAVEGQADDEETYPLGADHLDLAPLARDALLLALPLAPLCREDCPGLCPDCGADLADAPCACRRAPQGVRKAPPPPRVVGSRAAVSRLRCARGRPAVGSRGPIGPTSPSRNRYRPPRHRPPRTPTRVPVRVTPTVNTADQKAR